jgi:hypothetical protein
MQAVRGSVPVDGHVHAKTAPPRILSIRRRASSIELISAADVIRQLFLLAGLCLTSISASFGDLA